MIGQLWGPSFKKSLLNISHRPMFEGSFHMFQSSLPFFYVPSHLFWKAGVSNATDCLFSLSFSPSEAVHLKVFLPKMEHYCLKEI